jgi:hypothetical protein
MHNSEIMSVRKGDWKLFVSEPRYYKETDLNYLARFPRPRRNNNYCANGWAGQLRLIIPVLNLCNVSKQNITVQFAE